MLYFIHITSGEKFIKIRGVVKPSGPDVPEIYEPAGIAGDYKFRRKPPGTSLPFQGSVNVQTPDLPVFQ